MIYFFIILTILLAVALVLTLFTLDSRLKSQKKKLNLLSNQYNSIRKTSLTEKSLFKDLKIQYAKSPYNYGITAENVKVNYLPLEGFRSLIEIKSPLELYILEQCINNSEVWFYVDLRMQNNINSRGWIKKNDFSILRDDYDPLKSNLLN